MLPGPGGAVPPESAQRPGGYYLDDGPGEGPPVDPARVPDAIPQNEPPLPNANRPYEALGEVYFPDTSSLPYSDRGLASWYGRRFHGRRTSSGEPYDMYAMTGAHKTLPIPSYARVTDVLTGKSVVVRINDRGPFHPGRVIDLSYTAAAKLGFASRGSTEVLVERVFPAGISDVPPVAVAGIGSPDVAGAGVEAGAGAGTGFAAMSGAGAGGDANAGGSVPTSPANRDPTSEAATAPHAGSSTVTATAAPSPPPEAATATTSPSAAAAATTTSPSTTAATAEVHAGTGLFLQLGAFRSADNAHKLLTQARQALHGLGELIRVDVEGELHRVRLGPFPSSKAQNAAAGAVERALHLKPGLIGP